MAFQLKSDESVRKGLKRMVLKQIEKAQEGLQASNNSDQTVHDARKCCKRIRALLRLLRHELGDKSYQMENKCFRDAARPLTEVRDAQILIESLDKLSEQFAEQLTAQAFSAVRDELQRERKEIRKRVLKEQEAFPVLSSTLQEAAARVRKWSIRGKGWSLLKPGLQRVYAKGRRSLPGAVAESSVETLHELRKQAKYLWHQLQVLECVWPPVMKELEDQMHELTTLLGDDHDLAVLREKVSSAPDKFGGDSTVELLLSVIDRRREELQRDAFALGQRLYLDPPSGFVRHLQGYWKAWRSEVAV
jgi:CHAD domain-containing protein